ncbi:MAG: caspase family protein [Rhodocyclaceae bacterium]|nr:caspase family protein [Rhodocyclaceae bacterium]
MRLLRVLSMSCLALLVGMAGAAETRTPGGQVSTAKRLALVIGNDSYQKVDALMNARADARAMAKALAAAGFVVTLRLDLTEKATKEAVRRFKAQVGGGDEAVFYFSGHGVQLGGANYLLPIDIAGENEEQVKDEALPLQRVLDDLQEQKARFSLAIIDACRNNPFKGAGRSIGGRGLAPTSAATGQMVLFAAGANQQALDRLGPNDREANGLFTRVLLRQMVQPGVPVDRVLRGVRDEVVRLAKSVNHEQVPALYDQSIGDFFFRPGNGAAVPAAPQPAAPVDTSAMELAFWESAERSNTAADYMAYLSKFPDGQFVELARNRMNRQSGNVQVASVAPDISRSREAPVSAPAFPREGDFWRYRGSNQNGPDAPTYRVAKVMADTIEIRYVSNRNEQMTIVLNTDWNPLVQLGQEGAAEVKFVPFAPQYQFPLEPGKKWRGQYKGECGPLCSFEADYENEVRGWERIKVPAGTFEALRIDSRETFKHAFGISSSGTGSVWLAPELKNPVKFEYTYSGRRIKDYELEAYQMAK